MQKSNERMDVASVEEEAVSDQEDATALEVDIASRSNASEKDHQFIFVNVFQLPPITHVSWPTHNIQCVGWHKHDGDKNKLYPLRESPTHKSFTLDFHTKTLPNDNTYIRLYGCFRFYNDSNRTKCIHQSEINGDVYLEIQVNIWKNLSRYQEAVNLDTILNIMNNK